MKKICRAFTLAEVMIVLSVIGVLTAILLPVAFHSAPDENIIKFKKANNTLGAAIRELVNSDKYYANGDLGIKANGTIIDWNHIENYTYFCETLANVLNTKSVNCSDVATNSGGSVQTYVDDADDTENARNSMDTYCLNNAEQVGAEIITVDDIVFYQGGPNRTFGSTVCTATPENPNPACSAAKLNTRAFGENGYYKDKNNFDCNYKIICIDVDGIGKGEAPFGYGIRVDGRILPGARALEWINKSVQREN